MVPESTTSGERQGVKLALAAAGLLLVAGLAGYFQIFSTYAEYDDEGYVMMSLVSYMDGRPLYDQTYTQYGPAFFALQGAFHQLTGLPVTHDVMRVQTVAVWLVVSLLAMFFTFRVTRQWSYAAIAFLAAFLHLERLCLEPSHPQEFCVIALALAMVLATYLTSERSGLSAAIGLGIVCGILVMTKLNVGLFLTVSLGMAILTLGPQNRISRFLWWLGVTGAVALPIVLTGGHLRGASGAAIPVAVVCSVLAISRVSLSCRLPVQLGWPHLIGFVSATLLGSGLFVGLAWQQGVTWTGLWYGLIGQHRGFSDSFYTPAPLHPATILWCLLALDVAWRARQKTLAAGLLRVVLVGVFFFAALHHLPDTFTPLVHGLIDRGGAAALLSMAAPLTWLLLLPGLGIRGEETTPVWDQSLTARLALAWITCLQPLGVYPTPGTQMAVASLALVAAAILALHDVMRRESDWLPRAHLAAPALGLLLLAALLTRSAHFPLRWASLTPLNLPGASRLRLAAEDAEQRQWLVDTLRRGTSTFVFGEHASNSLYFWSGLRPPTALNPTFWPFLLKHDQQRRIIAALEQHPDASVVHRPFPVELPGDSPLLGYLDDNFEPAYEKGTWQVWTRVQTADEPSDRAMVSGR